MTVRFASLGSGSKGNSTLVDDGESCLLVDLGFSVKETVHRLARLGKKPVDITAILVTHEHGDHIHGVAPFARKFDIPVYLTHGTYQPKSMGQLPVMNLINCHRVFECGSFEVTPVAVPHDAKEPCQYVLRSSGATVGILTDLGHITDHVKSSYSNCDALLLECNHDLEMLEQGPYPAPLKRRVGGDYGHLNNHQAAALLDAVDLQQLDHLVISHISEQNNQPALAQAVVEDRLSAWSGNLQLADQQSGIDWVVVK
ncbi:MAG: MBL fold metallo-hydrolase [Proteobacteria bacterium]|nr:MBL fold metallo-hydrolase [Pseudomonadota bacterium]